MHFLRFRAVCLGSLLIFFISACSPTPTPSPPAPTPYPIRIQIDPGLSAVLPAVSACQAEQQAAVAFTELGINLQSQPDLIIGYAKNIGLSEQFLLGSDVLVPAASESRSGGLPSIDGLVGAYLAASGPDTSSTEISPVTFAQSSIFRQLFDQVLLEDQPEDPHILVSPDPESMQQLLLEDPNRVGYLPQSWLVPPLAEIPLPFELRRVMRLDIVVASTAPPNPAARRLIACLQSGAGQVLLAEIYLPLEK